MWPLPAGLIGVYIRPGLAPGFFQKGDKDVLIEKVELVGVKERTGVN